MSELCAVQATMMFIKLDLPIKSIEQGRTKLPALLNPFTGYSYLALSIEECITKLPPHKKWSSFILRQLMSVVSFSASTRTVNPQTIASLSIVPWKTLGKVLHSSSIPLNYCTGNQALQPSWWNNCFRRDYSSLLAAIMGKGIIQGAELFSVHLISFLTEP